MPKKIDQQAKKQEILLAAMKVFAQNGFANTKMIDKLFAWANLNQLHRIANAGCHGRYFDPMDFE